MDFLKIAYLKGNFVPFDQANISIATHALHYGTAAFAGLRGIPDPGNPKQILLFRLDRHCQRLSESARFLNYELPADDIHKVIVEFVKQNQPAVPFYIRPLVYTSDLGIAPRLHNVKQDLLVYGLELGDYLPPEGVKCKISSWCRQEDRSVPMRGKIAGTYVNVALAKSEAADAGFHEAILLNSQGKVAEATGMNVFIVRRGRLITPDVTQDILEGITRDSILTVANELGIECEVRPVDKSELLIAEEVFLSGTAARITPVNQIDNYRLPVNGPVTLKLKDKIKAITENRDPDHRDWVTEIGL